MKKFSTKTKTTSPKEKKAPKTKEQNFNLRDEIVSAMDMFLTVKSSGPVDNRFLQGSVYIDGKEEFIGALIDRLESKIVQEKKELLNDLKVITKDWKSLDEYAESNLDTREEDIIKEHLIDYIQRYDSENILDILNNKISNLSESKKSKYLKVINTLDFEDNNLKVDLIRMIKSNDETL